jgi:hypothetical protein
MQVLFEALRTHALDMDRISETVATLPSARLVDVLDDLRTITRGGSADADVRSGGPFAFVASDALAGGPAGCEHVACRRDRAGALHHFTALYAEKVLIRNPLDRLSDVKDYDPSLRMRLAGDLALLWHHQPLLEAGLVGFVQLQHHFCAACYPRYSVDTAKIERAAAYLRRRARHDLTFVALKEQDAFSVEVVGPDDLLNGHPHFMEFVYFVPEPLAKYAKKPGRSRISRRDADAADLIDGLWRAIIDDFAVQDWYTKYFDYSLLTDQIGRAHV